MPSATVPIPQPPPRPVVGNLPDIDSSKGVLGLVEVAEQYGPIVRIQFFSRSIVALSSQELVNEVCDESRFGKVLGVALREVRQFAGDGLFTAETPEPNWQKAHRILMPAFGPAALKRMFEGMDDIVEQLLLKWERLGPTARIDVPDNTTRLTLDTIALCSFKYRFNSLYREEMHPFVGAMVRALVESGDRARRLPVQNKIMLRRRHQLEEDNALMFEVAEQIISDRRRNPSPAGSEDILDTMLNAADPVTGERLSDENIRYQMVTFLIAGHETTSGLLSFTLYELMRHPAVLAKAHAVVDEVLGTESARFEHLPRLGYLDQILKETLRLWPTAPPSTWRRSRTRRWAAATKSPRASPSWSCSRGCTGTRRRGGEDRRHLRPGTVLPRAGRGNPRQCVEAFRQRAALLHRPGLCPAGGHEVQTSKAGDAPQPDREDAQGRGHLPRHPRLRRDRHPAAPERDPLRPGHHLPRRARPGEVAPHPRRWSTCSTTRSRSSPAARSTTTPSTRSRSYAQRPDRREGRRHADRVDRPRPPLRREARDARHHDRRPHRRGRPDQASPRAATSPTS